MNKVERDSSPVLKGRIQRDCRLSMKLAKRETGKVERLLSLERVPLLSKSQSKPCFKLE